MSILKYNKLIKIIAIKMDKKMSILNDNQQSETSSECIICSAELVFTTSLDIGELLECYECGTELEVESVSPLVLIEAPTEAEDWGQ